MSTSQAAQSLTEFSSITDLEGMDLAALLCSRVCHDVISPVGAIVNGLEVLDEEKDQGMREFALELIKKSATQASARLQFARIAFGAAGSAGAEIDLSDAHNVARGHMEDDRTKLVWDAPRILMPKNKVKLLLNLLILAQQAIPRGGEIKVSVVQEGENTTLGIHCSGVSARLPVKQLTIMEGKIEQGHAVDAHVIQPYYTAQLAKDVGMEVIAKMDGEAVVFEAK